MRFICFILSFYFLALSTVSCKDIAEDNCVKEEIVCGDNVNDDCSSSACEDGSNKPDGCSPFCTCNCCTGFTVSVKYFSLQKPEWPLKHKTFFYTEDLPSVESSIWQPPKA